MEEYIQLAKELGMVDAIIISPKDICFDIRAILKCRWGCEDLPVYDRKKVTKGETPLSSLCQREVGRDFTRNFKQLK